MLRKLATLEKLNILKKDKFKRYATHDFINSEAGKIKYYRVLEHTLNLLGIFISESIKIYSIERI